MRVYTITVALAEDDTEEFDRDWDKVAKAARLVALHVTQEGLPSRDGQQVRLRSGEDRIYLSPAIDIPAELVQP